MAGIKIKANFANGAQDVKATGSFVDVISDANRDKFKLKDGDLKNYVNKYWGKKPNDAYLHSKTPWGDLYKTYKWSQVKTTMKPIKAEVVKSDGVPTILANKIVRNDGPSVSTYRTGITQEVTTEISNTWKNETSVTIENEVSVSFEGLGGAKSKMGMTTTFGHDKTVSERSTVGTNDEISLTLKPGEAVDVQLTATKGKMTVRVTFECTLYGSVAVNYNPTYRGHHFFALGVNGVMKAGGAPSKKTITQDITIDFVTDTQIVIKDISEKKAVVSARPTRTASLAKKAKTEPVTVAKKSNTGPAVEAQYFEHGLPIVDETGKYTPEETKK